MCDVEILCLPMCTVGLRLSICLWVLLLLCLWLKSGTKMYCNTVVILLIVYIVILGCNFSHIHVYM